MDFNPIQSNLIQWFIIGVDRLPLHEIQTLKPINNPPKNRIQLIQFGQARVGDKKLAIIGIGATICHGDHTTTIMFQGFNQLILEWVFVDALASFTRVCGVTALDYEPFYVPVEFCVVV